MAVRSGGPPSPLHAGPHVNPERPERKRWITMADTLTPTPVKWLYCFACAEPFEMVGSTARCSCGRSSARLDGNILEVRGPTRALAPVETAIHVDGGEWMPVPEDVFIRRVLHRAA